MACPHASRDVFYLLSKYNCAVTGPSLQIFVTTKTEQRKLHSPLVTWVMKSLTDEKSHVVPPQFNSLKNLEPILKLSQNGYLQVDLVLSWLMCSVLLLQSVEARSEVQKGKHVCCV